MLLYYQRFNVNALLSTLYYPQNEREKMRKLNIVCLQNRQPKDVHTHTINTLTQANAIIISCVSWLLSEANESPQANDIIKFHRKICTARKQYIYTS